MPDKNKQPTPKPQPKPLIREEKFREHKNVPDADKAEKRGGGSIPKK